MGYIKDFFCNSPDSTCHYADDYPAKSLDVLNAPLQSPSRDIRNSETDQHQ